MVTAVLAFVVIEDPLINDFSELSAGNTASGCADQASK